MTAPRSPRVARRPWGVGCQPLAATLIAFTFAVAPAGAQSFGGGALSQDALASGRYTPTVGIALQPRPDGRIAIAWDSALRCNGRAVPVIARAVVAWDGVALRATGTSRVSISRRPVRFSWAVDARVAGDVANGALQISASRRGRPCAGPEPRPFEARLGSPPAGAAWRPSAGAVLYGSSANRLRGGLRAPVVLRVSRGGQRVAARWGVAARCTDGARERFTNLTPPARIGAAAGFRRRERFSLEYTNVFVRYRVAFRGRFVGAGARGSLRLRSVVFNRRGGPLIARCDTGRRAWSAWTGSEPAG